MADEEPADRTTESLTINRREVLAATGSAAVGVAAFSGTASAHEVSTVAFCGCTQVTVYGIELGADSSDYVAILYCDGDIVERDLTGTDRRVNYDMDADESIGPNDDCQIVAVKGTTYPHGDFIICNEHCPANCAAKGLAEADLDCDDPDDVTSGGSRDGLPEQTITVQCSGCGRDEPGHPGRPEDPGRGRGRGR